MALTSAITNRQQHLPRHIICHYIILYCIWQQKYKICRLTFSDTLFGQYKIMKSSIFFRLEESMLETGKSLSTKSKNCSVVEKITF